MEPTAFARKWGTEFDFFLSDINFGVETITNDVAWTRIIGGRSYYKLLSSPFPVFIGATAVWDREPAKDKLMRLANGDIVNVSSVEETSIYGCDIGIQLLQSDTVRLLLYTVILPRLKVMAGDLQHLELKGKFPFLTIWLNTGIHF